MSARLVSTLLVLLAPLMAQVPVATFTGLNVSGARLVGIPQFAGAGTFAVIANPSPGVPGAPMLLTPGATRLLGGSSEARGLEDLTGDGIKELVVRRPGDVVVQDGASGVVVFSVTGVFAGIATLSDETGDGKSEFAIRGASVAVHDGVTGALVRIVPVPPSAECLGRDLDGDLVFDWRLADQVLSGADGTVLYQAAPGFSVIDVVGDVDGDGALDVFTSRDLSSQVTVWRIQGWQSPLPIWSTSGGEPVHGLQALGDANGDGRDDWLLLSRGLGASSPLAASSRVSLVLGVVERTGVRLSSSGALGNGAALCSIGDLDGDGVLDFATLNDAGTELSVVLTRAVFSDASSTGGASCASFSLRSASPQPWEIAPTLGVPFALELNAPLSLVGEPVFVMTGPLLPTPLSWFPCPLWLDPWTASSWIVGSVPALAPLAVLTVGPAVAPLTVTSIQALIGMGPGMGFDLSEALTVRFGYWAEDTAWSGNF